jgi:hypothetical protein
MTTKPVFHAGTPEPELVYAYAGHIALKDAEIDRLWTERGVVWAWMREPDHVENASLEWLTEWINRRPLAACGPR